MADHDTYMDDSKITVILIGAVSAAFVVTVYHCVAVGWCSSQRQSGPSTARPGDLVLEHVSMPSSNENSTGQLIPGHKYQKGMGLVGDDGICAVCLSEFEEGEELRTLPECLHSYHAPCIDMWLYSHSNCPMCRADATPSPQIFRPPDSGGTENLESGVLQNVVVQSRTM